MSRRRRSQELLMLLLSPISIQKGLMVVSSDLEVLSWLSSLSQQLRMMVARF